METLSANYRNPQQIVRGDRTDRLHAEALGWFCPFPRRWPDLSHEQCRRGALRGIALGHRHWTFAGSQRGADRAAIMLSVITTCRLNDVDPKAWLADVFARIDDLPVSRLHELLPWQWKTHKEKAMAAAA
ncbi:hypothetical protein OKW20_006050 [Ensifer sp. LBL]